MARDHLPTPPPGLRPRPTPGGRARLPWALFAEGHPVQVLTVAAYLGNLGSDDEIACWASNDEIAHACGITPRSVQYALEALQSRGWVRRVRQPFRGKSRRVIWILWLLPDDFADVVFEIGDEPSFVPLHEPSFAPGISREIPPRDGLPRREKPVSVETETRERHPAEPRSASGAARRRSGPPAGV